MFSEYNITNYLPKRKLDFSGIFYYLVMEEILPYSIVKRLDKKIYKRIAQKFIYLFYEMSKTKTDDFSWYFQGVYSPILVKKINKLCEYIENGEIINELKSIRLSEKSLEIIQAIKNLVSFTDEMLNFAVPKYQIYDIISAIWYIFKIEKSEEKTEKNIRLLFNNLSENISLKEIIQTVIKEMVNFS